MLPIKSGKTRSTLSKTLLSVVRWAVSPRRLQKLAPSRPDIDQSSAALERYLVFEVFRASHERAGTANSNSL